MPKDGEAGSEGQLVVDSRRGAGLGGKDKRGEAQRQERGGPNLGARGGSKARATRPGGGRAGGEEDGNDKRQLLVRDR